MRTILCHFSLLSGPYYQKRFEINGYIVSTNNKNIKYLSGQNMEYQMVFENDKEAKEFINFAHNYFDSASIAGSIVNFTDMTLLKTNPRRRLNLVNNQVYINPVMKLTTNGKYIDFLKNDYLSDLEIVVGGQLFKVHRIILANGSQFFDRLFKSSFKEKGKERITIETDINFFSLLLKLLYGGQIALTPTTESLKFLQIVDYFGIKIDINLFISSIDVPEAEDFPSYLEGIHAIYHNEDDIPDPVINTIEYYLETYYESQDDEFFDSIRELLPTKLQY